MGRNCAVDFRSAMSCGQYVKRKVRVRDKWCSGVALFVRETATMRKEWLAKIAIFVILTNSSRDEQEPKTLKGVVGKIVFLKTLVGIIFLVFSSSLSTPDRTLRSSHHIIPIICYI
jgi:hypothetical protein